jgi:Ftsk gamma domain
MKNQTTTQDKLIPDCITAIREDKKASTSWLRKKFDIGYGRAARIMDELERLGVVGPSKGAGQRDILPETPQVKLTYEERGVVLKKESAVAEIKTINTALGAFDDLCHTMEKTTISAANKSREIGIHLKTICGHEQMPFSFWQSHCEGKVQCSFEQAKNHISVANKMPKPAGTIAEAAPFFQTLLFAGKLLESPERDKPQQRSTVSFVEKFFCELTLFRKPWKKIMSERPLASWDAPALDKFLSETEWLASERERAVELRKQLPTE